jgi:hypothetical protein
VESFGSLFNQIEQLGLTALVIERPDEPAASSNEFFMALCRRL